MVSKHNLYKLCLIALSLCGWSLLIGCLFDTPQIERPKPNTVTRTTSEIEKHTAFNDSMWIEQSRSFQLREGRRGYELEDTLITLVQYAKIDTVILEKTYLQTLEISPTNEDTTVISNELTQKDTLEIISGRDSLQNRYEARFSKIVDSLSEAQQIKEDSVKTQARVENGREYIDTLVTTWTYSLQDTVVLEKVFHADLSGFTEASPETLSLELKNRSILKTLTSKTFIDSNTVIKKPPVFPKFAQDSLNVHLSYPKEEVEVGLVDGDSAATIKGWEGEVGFDESFSKAILKLSNSQPMGSNQLVQFGKFSGMLNLQHPRGSDDTLSYEVTTRFDGFHPNELSLDKFWNVPEGPRTFFGNPNRFALTTVNDSTQVDPQDLAHVFSKFRFRGDFQLELTLILPSNTDDGFTVGVVFSPDEMIETLLPPPGSPLEQFVGSGYLLIPGNWAGISFNGGKNSTPLKGISFNGEPKSDFSITPPLKLETSLRVSRKNKELIFEHKIGNEYKTLRKVPLIDEQTPDEWRMHVLFGNFHSGGIQTTLTLTNFSIVSGGVILP